jgi:hypothetical protein
MLILLKRASDFFASHQGVRLANLCCIVSFHYKKVSSRPTSFHYTVRKVSSRPTSLHYTVRKVSSRPTSLHYTVRKVSSRPTSLHYTVRKVSSRPTSLNYTGRKVSSRPTSFHYAVRKASSRPTSPRRPAVAAVAGSASVDRCSPGCPTVRLGRLLSASGPGSPARRPAHPVSPVHRIV